MSSWQLLWVGVSLGDTSMVGVIAKVSVNVAVGEKVNETVTSGVKVDLGSEVGMEPGMLLFPNPDI